MESVTFVQGLAGFYLTKCSQHPRKHDGMWQAVPRMLNSIPLYVYIFFLLSSMNFEMISTSWLREYPCCAHKWSSPADGDFHSSRPLHGREAATLHSHDIFKFLRNFETVFRFLGLDDNQLSSLKVSLTVALIRISCWLEMLVTFRHLSLNRVPSLLWKNGSFWRDALFCFVLFCGFQTFLMCFGY